MPSGRLTSALLCCVLIYSVLVFSEAFFINKVGKRATNLKVNIEYVYQFALGKYSIEGSDFLSFFSTGINECTSKVRR